MATKILFLFLLVASVSFAGEKGGGAGNGGGGFAHVGEVMICDADDGSRTLVECENENGCNIAASCADEFDVILRK